MMSGLSPEAAIVDSSGQRRGSRSYQIFPVTLGTESESDTYSENVMYHRERLPSIVVEPTDQSDDEGNKLPRPPQRRRGDEEEEEEEDGCNEEEEGHMGRESQEKMLVKDSIIAKQSSNGPALLCQLTPPTSPTKPDSAPPCLRS